MEVFAMQEIYCIPRSRKAFKLLLSQRKVWAQSAVHPVPRGIVRLRLSLDPDSCCYGFEWRLHGTNTLVCLGPRNVDPSVDSSIPDGFSRICPGICGYIWIYPSKPDSNRGAPCLPFIVCASQTEFYIGIPTRWNTIEHIRT